MSAADRREELEATANRLLTAARLEGIAFAVVHPGPAADTRAHAARAILAAADAYAQACADDAWAAAEGQARLAAQVTP